MLKKILKFILYAGAVACCLAGLGVIFVAVDNFRHLQFPEWLFVLAVQLFFICLAFTPAFMFLKGLKTKTWHWVLITIVEVIVLAVASYALLFLIAISMGGE